MALFTCSAPFEFLMFYLRSSSYHNIFVGKTLLRAGNDIVLYYIVFNIMKLSGDHARSYNCS